MSSTKRIFLCLLGLAIGLACGLAIRSSQTATTSHTTDSGGKTTRTRVRALTVSPLGNLPKLEFKPQDSGGMHVFTPSDFLMPHLVMRLTPEEAKKQLNSGAVSPYSPLATLLWYQAAIEDPAGALAWWKDLKAKDLKEAGRKEKSPENDSTALSGIFKAWVRKDPLAALEAAKGDAAWLSILTTEWSMADPLAASRALENGRLPLPSLNILVKHWTQRNPEAALQWVANVRDPKLMKLDVDYRGAATAAPAHAGDPAEEWRAQRKVPMVLEWVAADPVRGFAAKAAMDWGKGFPEGTQKGEPLNQLNETLVHAANIVAATSPELAAKLVATLPQDRLTSNIASGFASGLEEARAGLGVGWALQLQDETIREVALGRCSYATNKRGDLQGTRAIIDHIQDPKARGAAAASLMNFWARVEPAAAREWLMDFRKTLPAEHVKRAVQQYNDEVKKVAPALLLQP